MKKLFAFVSTLLVAGSAFAQTPYPLTSPIGGIAAGTITNGMLANAATTVNGVLCTLGSTCTATAAAGTLSGTALAAGVTTSSLVSLGVLTTHLKVTAGVDNGGTQTHLGWDATAGAQLLGSGSAKDVSLYNKSGSIAAFIPTGTTDFQSAGSLLAVGLNISGSTVNMAGLGTSSAATSGTVCWTSGTGLINVDTTVACLSSDERLKLIGPAFSDATEKLMRLRPITYSWKPEAPRAKNDPGDHIGLGAFATGYVDERLIARDSEGNPRGWRTDAMIALTIASVQEQQHEIDELRRHLGIAR